MKLTTVLLIATLLHASAATLAQTVTLNQRNIQLKQVLRDIHKQTGYNVLWQPSKVDASVRINVDFNNTPLDEVMKTCLQGKPLSYTIYEKTILVTREIPDKVMEAPVHIDVKGQVLDENGKSVPGATIKVKGTQTMIATDNNGQFVLRDVDDKAMLVISFIGYTSQEIRVSSVMTIKLVPQPSGLNEVVVVGYGTQKKIDLTGSVATVTGDDLNKRQVVDPASMLEGKISGVDVVQSSGQPGATGTSIQIRGMGTYSGAGTNPLILIDGVPGNIEDVNPNSIASVSVLKDAASSAIYGAQAANGVILITTKDGSENKGKLIVNYTMNYGVSTPTKLPDLVTNSVQYMQLFNQAKTNSGIAQPGTIYPDSIINLYKNPSNTTLYPNANWASLMFKAAPTFMNTFSVSGGEKTTFNASIGYTNQTGVMQAFNFQRYVAQFNLASTISKRFKMGFNLNLNNGNTSQPINGAQDAFYQTIAHPPTALPYLPDGSGRYTYLAYPWESAAVRSNQFAEDNDLTNSSHYAVNSQVYTDLEIIDGLHWYTKAAANGSFDKTKSFSATVTEYDYLDPANLGLSSNIPGNGLDENMDQIIYTNLFSYLNYDKSFGKHTIGAQFGYSQEENNYYYLDGQRTSYNNGTLQELNAGNVSPQYNSGTSNAWSLQSFFGRLKYNFDEKYLFEANIRDDGSSRFAPGHRWGVFPSFSGAWRISQENFLKSQSSWLNDLKIRASWGQLGNQNIGLYPYQALISLGNSYPFDNANLSPGASQTALNSENISWETTTMSNIGFDATLFKHLDVTFDAYKKLTTNILRPAQVDYAVGLSAPTVNSGAMENKGLELALNYRNNVSDGWLQGLNYTIGFNISGFRNDVTKFGQMQDNGSTVIEEGKPWNSFYLLQFDGIFQNQAEINNSPKQYGDNLVPGDIKFKDTNHDGVINDEDRVVMTNGVFPAFSYGFNLSASMKGFDFYVFLQGVQGQKGIFDGGPGLQPFFSGIPPSTQVAAQSWTPENHSNTMPQLYFSDASGSEKVWGHPSTYFLYDMSYLRVKSLQLGYNLPVSLLKRVDMKNLRIYVSGDNLFTFTKFPGLDPENGGTYLAYPQNKIISLGLSVKF